jgi:hypothetical protein
MGDAMRECERGRAMWKSTWMRLVAGAVAMLGMVLAGPAGASTFSAVVLDGGNLSSCTPLGPSPASGSWTNSSNGFGSSSALAVAGAGVVHGTATAGTNGNAVSGTNSISACFRAEAVIDDVVISGPGSTVSVQVSGDLSGQVDTDATNASWGVVFVYASLEIGEVTESGIVYDGSTLVAFDPGAYTAPTSAVIDTTLTTNSIMVSTGTTLVVRMVLIGSVHSSDNLAAGSGFATADFSDGLSFSTSGPVFTLPAGFTANSADADIVDNQFGAPPAVPSLGGPAVALLAALVAALGARASRTLTQNV